MLKQALQEIPRCHQRMISGLSLRGRGLSALSNHRLSLNGNISRVGSVSPYSCGEVSTPYPVLQQGYKQSSSPRWSANAQFSTSVVSNSEATALKPKVVRESSSEPPKTSKSDAPLPSLPVPPLADTLTKYLRSVKPLLSNEEYEETVKIVKEFESGIGAKLQTLLEEKSKKEKNWLSEWWLNSAYLDYKDPVVVYSSPGLVFPLEDFKSFDDQVRYTAKLIFGALNFKQSIDNGSIKPDRMGKLPLDMSQYQKVFGTNRNPGEKRDELVYHPNSKHYVLAYKNHFFKMPAYNDSGEVFTLHEILNQVYYAVNEVNNVTSGLSGVPFGLLTTDNRTIWSKSFERLKRDKETRASINTIAEALFLVSLDRPNRPLRRPKGSVPSVNVEDLAVSDKQTVAALQMIHGNRTNSGNRWFDKTIQFIVGSEGECGLTYEHSPAEGPPIANLMDFIVSNLNQYESLLPSAAPPTYTSLNLLEKPSNRVPQKLVFNVNNKISQAITESKQRLEKLIDDLDMACFTFQKYGKGFIKAAKFSPDSYVQMAIQCAFYRIHQQPAAHYESASTRMYEAGRTETIRSCSMQALDFSKALCSPSVSSQEKYRAMKLAIEGHKNYAADAVRGHGVDRHLLGLKLSALENNMQIPKLYSDAGFVKSTHFRISTSQVPSIHQAFMCYGPLVQNGYGCCYNPQDNVMSFGISAYNSSTETNSEKFKIALQQTLLDMEVVASQNMQAKL